MSCMVTPRVACLALLGVIFLGACCFVSGSVSTRVRSYQREIDGVLQPMESISQHGERIIIEPDRERSLVEADVTAEGGTTSEAIRDKIARAHNDILGDANKGYFDPHNHNSGIMHWLGTAFATEQGNAIVRAECVVGGPGTMRAAIDAVLAWINLPGNQFFGEYGLKAWDTSTPNAPYDLYCFSLMTSDQLKGYRVSGWKSEAKVRAWFAATTPIRSGPGNIASPAIPIAGIDRARKVARDAVAAGNAHNWAAGAALFATLNTRMAAFKKDLLWTLRDNVLEMATNLAANPGANRGAFSPVRIVHNSQTAPALVGCIRDAAQALNGVRMNYNREKWRKLGFYLENLLSASSLIDYDSSYVIRNYIMEKSPAAVAPQRPAAVAGLPMAYLPAELEINGILRQYRFAVQQLIDGRITYVELSATPSGVPIAPRTLAEFQASQLAFNAALVAVVGGGGGAPAGAALKRAAQLYLSYQLYNLWYDPLIAARITVKFLVMGLGKLFAAAVPAPAAPGGALRHGWYRSTSRDGEVCLFQPSYNQGVVSGTAPASTTDANIFLNGLDVTAVAPWAPGGRISVEAMLGMPHVIGLDFASPEHHCFGYVPRAPGVGAWSTRQGVTRVAPGGAPAVVAPTFLRDANTPLRSGGYANLVAIVTVVNQVALARKKRLQFHVHNGEAYPIFNKAAIFPAVYGAGGAEEQDEVGHADRFVGQPALWDSAQHFGMGAGGHVAFCAESVRLFNWPNQIPVAKSEVHRNPAKPHGDPEEFFPVHYARGRVNVIRLAQMIRNIQQVDFPGIDKHTRFRFGHATHADLTGAQLMKAANIGADINLSSNLATLALVWNQFAANQAANINRMLLSDIDERLEAFHAHVVSEDANFTPAEAALLAAAIQGDKDQWIANYLAYALADHGLWNLIAADVDVYLGTDGSGTEHSGHRQDYIILGHMVRAMLLKTRQRGEPSPQAKERMRVAGGIAPELLAKIPSAAFIKQSQKVAAMTLDIAVRSFVDAQFYQRAYEYVNWINIGA